MSTFTDGKFIEILNSAFASGAAVVALGAVAAAVLGGLKSVVSVKRGSIEVSIGQITSKQIDSVSKINEKDTKPFEITALANYYNQALGRAQISFWFSIVFAAIGFGVIIFAFLTHSSEDISGTIVKVVSGSVIEAVSSLFFIQSTNAQRSMGEFFEKLRLDRLNAEAREMISEIENIERRDQLRSQLILKYSGIDRLLVGG